MNYDWDFTHIWLGFDAYLSGAGTTIQLALLCCVAGTMGGVILALLLRSHRVIRLPLSGTIFLLRGVPELVLLFFFYFFPYKQIFGTPPPNPFWCAFFAFSMGLSVFTGGLFDSALRQIPAHQLLGATALGLNRIEIFRHVIIPNVLRTTLPSLLAFWISILKLTSLASVIGVRDVVYVARIGMSENARALEAWSIVAVLYVTLVLPLSLAAQYVERLPWMKHQ